MAELEQIKSDLENVDHKDMHLSQYNKNSVKSPVSRQTPLNSYLMLSPKNDGNEIILNQTSGETDQAIQAFTQPGADIDSVVNDYSFRAKDQMIRKSRQKSGVNKMNSDLKKELEERVENETVQDFVQKETNIFD